MSGPYIRVKLYIIQPGWLELPLARTSFHGAKPVPAIGVILYIYSNRCLLFLSLSRWDLVGFE